MTSAFRNNIKNTGCGDMFGNNPVRVCVVDYIGSHCGMHYYDDSFLKILNGIDGVSSVVLSNYSSDGDKPFFRNFYNVPKVLGVVFLLTGYAKLLWRVLRDRKTVYVVHSFGNFIDVGMIWITSLAIRCVVDVHEVIAQRDEDKPFLHRCLAMLYRRRVRCVVIHSDHSWHTLDMLGYLGRRFFVPHFRYGVSQQYDKAMVGKEVSEFFDADKINFLFFGNIMYEKGIDLLFDAVASMAESQSIGLRVVVAGKSTDNTLSGCDAGRSDVFRVMTRHINDDELAFLYSGTDFVVLPYRKTSQSGILEMAFHFRKPVIVARLPYFERVLSKYPSFGVLTDTDADSLSRTMIECSEQYCKDYFFKPDDVYSYEHGVETALFAQKFGVFLLNETI